MKRRMVLAQLVVFAVISVLVIGYAVFGLLRVNLTNSPFTVTVQLHTAGGIFDGAEVAFHGVQVGKVTDVALHTDGVTVTMNLDQGTEVPENSIAHVYDLSAVGEQYIDLEPPERPSTSNLHDGSVIEPDHTTVPIETATVLYDLERFIDSVNPADLRTIGREGAAAFKGTGPQLRSILADATRIVNQLSASEDSMLHLLDNSALLLHGAASHRDEFDSFTRSLTALSATLAQKTPAISGLIQQSPATTRIVNALIADNGAAITELLANTATLSQIQSVRVPGFEALLLAVPEFGRLAPKLVKDGHLQAVAEVNISQHECQTGVPLSNPLSGKATRLYDVHCGPDIARGAANAPRSAGGASAQSAGRHVQVGTYDPGTGLTSTNHGRLIRIGTNGGTAELFGRNSWQTLLLAGTGS
jgi:phospholipid/cholesterol/gamma-HCH transport system substrate-binding protein